MPRKRSLSLEAMNDIITSKNSIRLALTGSTPMPEKFVLKNFQTFYKEICSSPTS
jgi:hypothetical protein